MVLQIARAHLVQSSWAFAWRGVVRIQRVLDTPVAHLDPGLDLSRSGCEPMSSDLVMTLSIAVPLDGQKRASATNWKVGICLVLRELFLNVFFATCGCLAKWYLLECSLLYSPLCGTDGPRPDAFSRDAPLAAVVLLAALHLVRIPSSTICVALSSWMLRDVV